METNAKPFMQISMELWGYCSAALTAPLDFSFSLFWFPNALPLGPSLKGHSSILKQPFLHTMSNSNLIDVPNDALDSIQNFKSYFKKV